MVGGNLHALVVLLQGTVGVNIFLGANRVGLLEIRFEAVGSHIHTSKQG